MRIEIEVRDENIESALDAAGTEDVMLVHGACVMHNDYDLPDGWVEIQRDDDLAVFADDGEAARACSTEAREHRIVGERYVWIVPAKDALRPLTHAAKRILEAGYRIAEEPGNPGHVVFEHVPTERTWGCGRVTNGTLHFCDTCGNLVMLRYVGLVTAADVLLALEHTRGAP